MCRNLYNDVYDDVHVHDCSVGGVHQWKVTHHAYHILPCPTPSPTPSPTTSSPISQVCRLVFVTGVAYVPPDVPHAPTSLEPVLRAWLLQLRQCVELQEWRAAVVEELRGGHHVGKEDPVVCVGVVRWCVGVVRWCVGVVRWCGGVQMVCGGAERW